MSEVTKAAGEVQDPFDIYINVEHPTCDPARISDNFSMKPAYSWKAGQRLGPIVKAATRWRGKLAEGKGATEYEGALAAAILFLERHGHFIAELGRHGGDVELELNHAALLAPKGVAFDLRLSVVLLGQLAQHSVSLRIRAWSEKPSWVSASDGG